MTYTLSVYGRPATKGSTVSFIGASGKVITRTDSTRLAPWTDAVRWACREAQMTLANPDVPVHVSATFVAPKPKTAKRSHPTTRPDIDKWARALLDALTGMAYHDDAQVVGLNVDKCYGTAWVTHVQVSVADGYTPAERRAQERGR